MRILALIGAKENESSLIGSSIIIENFYESVEWKSSESKIIQDILIF